MILVDTSAWIEFLRDTGSEVCVAVDRLLDADLASCDAVSMEILAGARAAPETKPDKGPRREHVGHVPGPSRSVTPPW